MGVGFVVFNAIFNLISAVSFIVGGNRSMYPEITTDLTQVTDKHYHKMLY